MIDHYLIESDENVRKIPLTSGNVVKLVRTDPFGLWHIEFESGKVPEILEGRFTVLRTAKEALYKWASKSGYEFGNPPPKPEVPEIAYKKVRKKEEK